MLSISTCPASLIQRQRRSRKGRPRHAIRYTLYGLNGAVTTGLDVRVNISFILSGMPHLVCYTSTGMLCYIKLITAGINKRATHSTHLPPPRPRHVFFLRNPKLPSTKPITRMRHSTLPSFSLSFSYRASADHFPFLDSPRPRIFIPPRIRGGYPRRVIREGGDDINVRRAEHDSRRP